MKPSRPLQPLCALLLFSVADPAFAQAPAARNPPAIAPARAADGLVIAGDLGKPRTLRLDELKALPSRTATWALHGKTHTVVGLPLEVVLAQAGYDRGPMSKEMAPRDKRPGFKLAIVASAPDGFQAVFSAAEITSGMGKTEVLCIWEMDGKPLPAEQGPLRLVVLTDGEGSRSIHNLARLDVFDLRKLLAARGG